MSITQQLKDAINESGILAYKLAEETGVSNPVIYRFITGSRPHLRSDTINVLCDYFGLELRKKTGTTAKKRVAKKTTATPKQIAKKKR